MSGKDIIFIIGFMGSGKSTVSRVLSEKTNLPLFEMDQIISEKMNKSINEIFDEYGEYFFREIESKTFFETLSKIQSDNTPSDGAIVSCGGGLPLLKSNSNLMKKHGTIVYLTASPLTLYERLANSKDRPLLGANFSPETISNQLDSRISAYEEIADLTISTEERSPEEIANVILALL